MSRLMVAMDVVTPENRQVLNPSLRENLVQALFNHNDFVTIR